MFFVPHRERTREPYEMPVSGARQPPIAFGVQTAHTLDAPAALTRVIGMRIDFATVQPPERGGRSWTRVGPRENVRGAAQDRSMPKVSRKLVGDEISDIFKP